MNYFFRVIDTHIAMQLRNCFGIRAKVDRHFGAHALQILGSGGGSEFHFLYADVVVEHVLQIRRDKIQSFGKCYRPNPFELVKDHAAKPGRDNHNGVFDGSDDQHEWQCNHHAFAQRFHEFRKDDVVFTVIPPTVLELKNNQSGYHQRGN